MSMLAPKCDCFALIAIARAGFAWRGSPAAKTWQRFSNDSQMTPNAADGAMARASG